MTDQATAPEMPTPEPGPITPENVVSQPEAPAAPDSSILSQRINEVIGAPPQEQKPDYSGLIEQMKAFEAQQQQAQKPQKPDYDNELRELRERYEELQKEFVTRDEMHEREQASHELASWVRSNETHFPLLNAAGYQNVPFQKILNTKDQTGRIMDAGQAAREVEEELSALIKRCAPMLGFVMRDEQTTGSDEGEINANQPGLQASVPPNWDDVPPEDAMAELMRQAERQFR